MILSIDIQIVPKEHGVKMNKEGKGFYIEGGPLITKQTETTLQMLREREFQLLNQVLAAVHYGHREE